MSIDIEHHSKIDNLDQKWRRCAGCYLYYPVSELVKRDGKYWCFPHYTFRFRNKDRDKVKVRFKDNLS